jgi:ABC-type lipoprotein release transport system permease subunit
MSVVAFVACAMILVMSAFNGLELLIEDLFSSFDAPITIVAKQGMQIEEKTIPFEKIQQLEGVTLIGKVIENDAWLQYNNSNTVATIKGIEAAYVKTLPTDSMVYSGEFLLEEDSANYAVVGLGVRGELQFPSSLNQPVILNIKTPVAGRRLSTNRENAFNETNLRVTGIFTANAELDKKYIFLPFRLARELYEMDSSFTSLEIQTSPNTDLNKLKEELQVLLPDLKVQTREDKNAIVYKTNQSEKWATYLILVFILIIASFNILASLTLLIIEKKKDIHVMYSMGATKATIRNIFILEGVFINLTGAVIGTAIGLLLTYLQQTVGLVRMQGAVVEFYPVHIIPSSVALIFVTVCTIGSLFCLAFVPALLKKFQYNKSQD